jgi:Zinc carboxypeptidase
MSRPSPLVLGHSVEGRPIVVFPAGKWSPEPSAHSTLLIGGTHGDEFATVSLLQDLHAGSLDRSVAILAIANPDGAEQGKRYNARGVDLNRNFGFNWRADSVEPPGAEPWSEPETRALRDFILAWRPAKIIGLHWALAEIDADGLQSTSLAEAMWAALDATDRRSYRLRVTELGRGQRRLEQTYAECPGSLGQWAGYGLAYPDGSQPAMITLELPYDPALPRPDSLPADHLAGLHERWASDAKGYLRAVEPGVQKMLRTACAHASPAGFPS